MEKIRLSDAIEKGSRLRGKSIGALFEDNRSCALGAAYEYVFDRLTRKMLKYSNEERMYSKICSYWPKLQEGSCCKKRINLGDHIVLMNDDMGFTRLQIAEHLRAKGF